MVTGVALPYQIYMETRSTLMVGLLSLSQLLPLLFTALVGGVFADRYHRRKLLLIAEFSLAVGSLLLAWNASLLTPHIWAIFIVATLMSAMNGLHRPALESVVQQIVLKKDLPIVSSLNTFKFSLLMIAGPAIGGLIIAHYGVAMTFMIDFISFFVSLSALILMGSIPKLKAVQDEATWAALKSGVRYAFSRQELVG